MPNDLTTSAVERQNILNNPYAVEEIQRAIGVRGIEFRDKVVLLKEQMARFFEVAPRTVENYLATHEAELRTNGYEVLRGKSLQELRLAIHEQFGAEMDFGTNAINRRTGGGTKYINQRDEDFIHAYFQEENYRKEFTDALRDYVEMGILDTDCADELHEMAG